MDIIEYASGGLFVASLCCIAWAVSRRAKQGCVLPQEPRWPAPWGPIGAILVTTMVVLTVLAAGAPGAAADVVASKGETIAPKEFAWIALADSIARVALAGFCLFGLRFVGGATRADVGLPQSVSQFRGDCLLGVVAGVGALVPVYAVLSLLVWLTEDAPSHPLLELVRQDPNPYVFLAAFASAVIAAPLFEEVLFRLLFQGWLESAEDRAVRLLERGEDEREAGEGAEPQTPAETVQLRTGPPPEPPAGMLLGMPYGWLPVVVSALAFALVHIGQGPAPAPLFVFGLVVGYLYQRTHRITPGIVAHMTFNMISLTLTWFAPS